MDRPTTTACKILQSNAPGPQQHPKEAMTKQP